MNRTFAPRRLVVAGVVGLLLAGGVGFFGSLTSGPQQPPVVVQPLPHVEQSPLTQTDLQQVRDTLGPFATILVANDTPTPDTHAPSVLILNQNASTEASQAWTVPFDSTQWAQRDIFQIRSLSLKLGYVTIGTNVGRTFVVRANQPFIFEDTPEQLYLIDGNGVLWTITTARAEALRQPTS
jgi:hypothetical protein